MATKYALDAALKLYRTKPGENRHWLEVGTGVYDMPVSDTTYDDSTDYYLLLITCVI